MPDARALGQTSASSLGWSRWGICALLFFATTLNYIDRRIIGILKPELSRQLGWSEIDYSTIVFAFQVAYAIGYAGAGRLIDRLGVRLGYFLAVLLIGLAAAAHQGFAANLYTLVSDIAPRQSVSSIVGIGGMAGTVGGMLFAKFAGYVRQWTGAYWPLFLIASRAYLLSLLIIHVLNPHLKSMEFDPPRTARP